MSSLMAPLYYSLLFMCAKKYTGYRWGWVNFAGISWLINTWSYILNIVWQKWENYDGVPSFWWVNSQRTKSNLIFLVIGQTSIIESHIYIRTYTLSCLFHGLQNVSEKCGLHDQKKKKKHLRFWWRTVLFNYSLFMDRTIKYILGVWYMGYNCVQQTNRSLIWFHWKQ